METLGLKKLGNRNLGLVSIGLAAGIVIVGCSSSNPATPSTPSVKVPPTATATSPTVSETAAPVKVGQFTYTVESVKNAGPTLSSDQGETMAQGEFIVATLTATNNGKSTEPVDVRSFSAETPSGQSASADPNDSIVATGSSTVILRGIPAGATQSVSLAFDFNPATKELPNQLIVKEPGSSKAVTIKLS